MNFSPAKYAPYHTMPAFDIGQDAYANGNYSNPYNADSVNAQAWDRGLEYGMKLARMWDGVGMN